MLPSGPAPPPPSRRSDPGGTRAFRYSWKTRRPPGSGSREQGTPASGSVHRGPGLDRSSPGVRSWCGLNQEIGRVGAQIHWNWRSRKASSACRATRTRASPATRGPWLSACALSTEPFRRLAGPGWHCPPTQTGRSRRAWPTPRTSRAHRVHLARVFPATRPDGPLWSNSRSQRHMGGVPRRPAPPASGLPPGSGRWGYVPGDPQPEHLDFEQAIEVGPGALDRVTPGLLPNGGLGLYQDRQHQLELPGLVELSGPLPVVADVREVREARGTLRDHCLDLGKGPAPDPALLPFCIDRAPESDSGALTTRVLLPTRYLPGAPAGFSGPRPVPRVTGQEPRPTVRIGPPHGRPPGIREAGPGRVLRVLPRAGKCEIHRPE